MKNEKVIYQNSFLTVKEIDNTFIKFGRNKTTTGAIIVPVTHDGKVILIKEYRLGIDGSTIAVPKGAADFVCEPAHSIAERELAEEIGATFGHLEETPLTAFPLPTFTDFSGTVVIAHDVEITGKQNLEHGESIEEYARLTTAELRELLMAGGVQDAESAMALQYYLLSKQTFEK